MKAEDDRINGNDGSGEPVDNMYNVHGQRYHPYGNPYDYQHQNNNNLVAALAPNYTSTNGNQGNQQRHATPLSYEEKYMINNE